MSFIPSSSNNFEKTLVFSDQDDTITWETAVLLKCDLNEEKGDFKVWTDNRPQNIVSDKRNY